MAKGKCALCPLGGAGDELGGYKGFGWAVVVELLSTAFQSGPFGPAVSGINISTLYMSNVEHYQSCDVNFRARHMNCIF
jgi:LDH2 family malate/lactate/ureidoglycolate dehydrogenase